LAEEGGVDDDDVVAVVSVVGSDVVGSAAISLPSSPLQ
jgi:hypothetical protein